MIVVCLKWVDTRPGVDPLTGDVHTDQRTSGASPADQAALEWALRTGDPVLALTAGPAAAEPMLRDALAAGAARAARVELDPATPSESVAAALVGAIPSDVDLVICGVWSVDRGSGSVPAFIAAHLGVAQALGLTTLTIGPETILAERRLDRGRRERLSVTRPAVLSVEAGSARLRRASLDGVLAARTVPIDRSASPAAARMIPARSTAFRPRPRVLPAPAGETARERILALTGALQDRTPPQRLVLDPPDAADRILDQLRTWGYVE